MSDILKFANQTELAKAREIVSKVVIPDAPQKCEHCGRFDGFHSGECPVTESET